MKCPMAQWPVPQPPPGKQRSGQSTAHSSPRAPDCCTNKEAKGPSWIRAGLAYLWQQHFSSETAFSQHEIQWHPSTCLLHNRVSVFLHRRWLWSWAGHTWVLAEALARPAPTEDALSPSVPGENTPAAGRRAWWQHCAGQVAAAQAPPSPGW